MKKSKKYLIIMLSVVLSLLLIVGISCLIAYFVIDNNNENQENNPILSEYSSIIYVMDDEILFNDNIKNGQNIIAPTIPIKDEALFDGWYTDSGTWENKIYDGHIVRKNMILYARWNYMIKFVSSGSYVDPILVLEGLSCNSTLISEKYNAIFDGWYTESGEKFDLLNGIVEERMTLTAHWKYLINFDSAGGAVVKSINVSEGELHDSLPKTTREGMVFSGWIDEHGILCDQDYILTENINLTAQWSYTMHFDSNGGTGVTDKYVLQNTISPVDYFPIRPKYRFLGWFTDSGERIDLGVHVVVSNLNLTAKWERV